MDIANLARGLQQDAPLVVFFNVLLQQAGLPVPVLPTLLLAGSLAASPWSLAQLLGAAVAASVLPDLLWYALGRRFGYRLLAGLCRVSINPSSCVSLTEARFARWGVASLLVAKFVPGFSTVAPPIAGTLRMPLPRFMLAATAGAALWAGAALCAGWALRAAVPEAIDSLDRHAGRVLLLLIFFVGLWLAWKLWQRRRFHVLSRMPHISADELLTALAGSAPPLLLDLRGAALVAASGAIPGAIVTDQDGLEHAVTGWPKDRGIVTLCACPQDAGAVHAARRLRELGYSDVRPLTDGYEAWLAASRRQQQSAPAPRISRLGDVRS